MDRTDDSLRYIEHIQRQLFTEGSWEIHKYEILHAKKPENINRLREIAKAFPNIDHDSLVKDYEDDLEKFEPETEFDSFHTKAIFRPLLEEVIETAKRAGIELSDSIEFANSPSSDISPVSSPASGNHKLFIGHGTSTFCNYWSKAFAWIVEGLVENGFSSFEPEHLDVIVRWNPDTIILPSRLALYYAHFDSLIGFGIVPNPSIIPFRLELLKAMEFFITAHEFTHFVAEEYWSKYQGFLAPDVSQKLELECDALGFALTVLYGQERESWTAFTGAGALIFFRAYLICENFARTVQPGKHPVSKTHPSTQARISQIRELAAINFDKPEGEAIKAYLADVDKIFDAVEKVLTEILDESLHQEEKISE